MGANRKRGKVKSDCVGRALIHNTENWKRNVAARNTDSTSAAGSSSKKPVPTDSGGSQFHLMPHMFQKAAKLEQFLAGSTTVKQPKSVLERTSLDEFLECSLWSQQEYNKSNAFRIVVGGPSSQQPAVIRRSADGVISRAGADGVTYKAIKKDFHLSCGAFWEGGVSIPRRSINYMTGRPTEIVSVAELTRLETEEFLKWRRNLAKVEEEFNLVVSPFERNLEFWRQLWRVLEKSDVVVQILDVRNPLFYRCIDLEKYVKEIRTDKLVILLMNKSDLVPYEVRKIWAAWFRERGAVCLFFSALDELKLYEQKQESESAAEAASDASAAGAAVEEEASVDSSVFHDESDGISKSQSAAAVASSADGIHSGENNGLLNSSDGRYGRTMMTAGELNSPSSLESLNSTSDSLLLSSDVVRRNLLEQAGQKQKTDVAEIQLVAPAGEERTRSEICGNPQIFKQKTDDDCCCCAETDTTGQQAGFAAVTLAPVPALAPSSTAAPVPAAVPATDLRAAVPAPAVVAAVPLAVSDLAAAPHPADVSVAPPAAPIVAVNNSDSIEDFMWQYSKDGKILPSTEFLHVLQEVKKFMSAKYNKEAELKQTKRNVRFGSTDDYYNDDDNISGDIDGDTEENVDDHEDDDDDVDEDENGGVDNDDDDDNDSSDDDDDDDVDDNDGSVEGDDSGSDTRDHPGNNQANVEQGVNNGTAATAASEQNSNKKLFRMQRDYGNKHHSFTIGFVGYPNVGKSSIINSLLKHKAVSVSRQPGKTKHFQTLPLPALGLTLCDCPGLVFPQIVSTAAHLVVYGVSPIDHVKGNYFGPIQIVCDLISSQLISQYNLESKVASDASFFLPQPPSSSSSSKPSSATQQRRLDALKFLVAFAASRGFVSGGKGAVPDMWQAAKIVLRDFTTGKLKFCILPPHMNFGDFSNIVDSAAATEAGKSLPSRESAEIPISSCVKDATNASSSENETMKVELEKDDILLLREATAAAPSGCGPRKLTKRAMRFDLKREIKARGFWHVSNY